MTDQNEAQPAHPPLHAGHTGVVVSQLLGEDWTPSADPATNAFTEATDGVLHLTADLARRLVGAHQAAAALILEGDWTRLRKYFSLSPRYAAWYDYRTPAVGFGIHADVVKQNVPIRLTQAELERHPDWHGFGTQASQHPPLRGWLAVPLLGQGGRNYGLLQLSDKYDDQDFTQEDETQLTRLAQLTAKTLDAIHRMYSEEEKKMATHLTQEEMKAFVRQHFEDFVNNKKAEVIRHNMTPDFYDHDGPGGKSAGVEDDEKMMQKMYDLMPDIQVTIEDMIAEGDKVVCRNSWRWKDAKSGTPMEFHGFVLWRFEGNQIAERWATVTAPREADE